MAKKEKDANDEKFLKDLKFVDRRTKAEVDSAKKDRKKGGLNPMKIPMLADRTTEISANYGCLC